MKIAVLLQMSPIDVLDLVGRGIGGAARYEGVRDTIRATVTNRIAMEFGPAPMDIGHMDDETAEYEPEYIGIVGSGVRTCLACGEKGRFARECATKGGAKRWRK